MALMFSMADGAHVECLFLHPSCAPAMSFSLEMERELGAFVVPLWVFPFCLGFRLVVRSLAICSVPCVL